MVDARSLLLYLKLRLRRNDLKICRDTIESCAKTFRNEDRMVDLNIKQWGSRHSKPNSKINEVQGIALTNTKKELRQSNVYIKELKL